MGATSVYLNCIKKLNLNSALVSIDREKIAFYKEGQPPIGEEMNQLAEFLDLTNFQLITGKLIPEVCDEIGLFDMIIMDTVHFIPGEVLDLLCLKNNISKNTIIILDDINIESRYPNLYPENLKGVASNAMILSSLNGTLLFPKCDFPEIGGIVLKDHTFDENRLLLCLCHKWNSDLGNLKKTYFSKIRELYGASFLKKIEVLYDKYQYSNFN